MLPRLVGLETPRSRQFEHQAQTYDHQRVYHHHGPWRDHLFYHRLTSASSRSRCSRPERGQPKVPFSACRCPILVVDYRWGSMGSNETATATTGSPRLMDVFDGNGAPSGPNYLLFSGAARLSDALRDRSGVGWSPRPHTPVLGAPQSALDPKLGGLELRRRALPGQDLSLIHI